MMNNISPEQLNLLNSMLNFNDTISLNSSYIMNSIRLQQGVEIYKDPIIFELNNKTYSIPVDKKSIFQNAIDYFENLTNSKGQNRYYYNGNQLDPNKSLEEIGFQKNSKITAIKYNNFASKGISLRFKKQNISEIVIQGSIDEPLMKFVGKYFQKLCYNGQQLEQSFSLFCNDKKLLEDRSPSYYELKDNDVIEVRGNSKILTVIFDYDGSKYSLTTYENETIGELIAKFVKKKNLDLNDKYWFVYQGKIITDTYKTLKELSIRNGSEINVVPPGIQGA